MRLVSGLTILTFAVAACSDDSGSATATTLTATNPVTSISGTSSPGDTEPESGTTSPTTALRQPACSIFSIRLGNAASEDEVPSTSSSSSRR